MRKNSLVFTIAMISIIFASSVLVFVAAVPPAPAIPLLDPKTIPQFVNELTEPPPVYVPTVANNYTVGIAEDFQQILPTKDALGNPTGFGKTKIWGYKGTVKNAVTGNYIGVVTSAPGATFEVTKGTPINVKWINTLANPHMFPVDPSLHFANTTQFPFNLEPYQLMAAMAQIAPPWNPPTSYGFDGTPILIYPPGSTTPVSVVFNAQSPVPTVTHLHGGEVPPQFDGGPDAWFTSTGVQGKGYRTLDPTDPNAAIYNYPNTQPATTLWYHDHALGITRLNVMSGLAGFYLLRDIPANDPMRTLFTGKYDMPLAVQDRTFQADGSFFFPSVGINPAMHPYWVPEFFGNTIMVNGKVWPNMNVEKGWYRFRLLDGSNARFYTITLRDQTTGLKLPFVQIGSDGGYLKAPVTLKELTIAPGERADILVDFSGVPTGTKILVENKAKAPFPRGAQADPRTTGRIMQFTVVPAVPGQTPTGVNPALASNPALSGPFPTLLPQGTTKTRIFTLVEVMGMAGPAEILLNGQRWDAIISENVELGSQEDWVIVNPTADTHPIHLHLVQFQLVSRQSIDTKQYYADWIAKQAAALGAAWDPLTMPPFPDNFIPLELGYTPYLMSKAQLAPPNEQGWKDTIMMHPGEVTIIRMLFKPIDGSPSYSFDATGEPGYVWHCHILDHEDNEMMRPYRVTAPVP